VREYTPVSAPVQPLAHTSSHASARTSAPEPAPEPAPEHALAEGEELADGAELRARSLRRRRAEDEELAAHCRAVLSEVC
jgi:hypothetical protein